MSGHVKPSGMNTPPGLDDEIDNKMLNLKSLSRIYVY